MTHVVLLLLYIINGGAGPSGPPRLIVDRLDAAAGPALAACALTSGWPLWETTRKDKQLSHLGWSAFSWTDFMQSPAENCCWSESCNFYFFLLKDLFLGPFIFVDFGGKKCCWSES